MSDSYSYRKFIQLASLVEDKKLRTEFFDLFLTPDERRDIGQRLEIIHELLKGELPQREIAKKINASIAKITRGSNCLKGISEDLKELIVSFESEEALTINETNKREKK